MIPKEEVLRIIEQWSEKPKFFETNEETGKSKLSCESLKRQIRNYSQKPQIANSEDKE